MKSPNKLSIGDVYAPPKTRPQQGLNLNVFLLLRRLIVSISCIALGMVIAHSTFNLQRFLVFTSFSIILLVVYVWNEKQSGSADSDTNGVSFLFKKMGLYLCS